MHYTTRFGSWFKQDNVALLLRVGVCLCFIGHGAFGIMGKEAWVVYFAVFSIPEVWAWRLMPVVGAIDIAVGVLALFWPTRALLAYGTLWCVFTASLRPLAGQGIAEFLERAGNYGVPLALLVLVAGAWAALPPALTPVQGAFEVSLALACILSPSATLFASIALWKLATEALFLVAGAPIWEFVERAGSYAAPLTLTMLLRRGATVPAYATRGLAGISPVVLLGVACVALPSALHAQSPRLGSLTPELLGQLESGGFVFACRHAITDHTREDRQPIDFNDASTQRVLSADGERQASATGQAIRALGIPITDVRASPFQRTRRSAELMFGKVVIDSTLYGSGAVKDEGLRKLLGSTVEGGGNRVLNTHQGVLYRMLRLPQGSIAEGDCIIVKPTGTSFDLVAQVRAAEWK